MFEELRRIGIEVDLDLVVRIGSLILARVLGAAFATPFLGGRMIPGRLKFGIPLVFSVFLYPFVAASIDPARVPPLGLHFVGLVTKELFVGYALGYIVSLPFYAVEIAGSFMDTQRGTTFAQVVAPLSGGQTSLLGQFYLLLFLAIFLGLGGAQYTIAGIGESFKVLPLLAWPPAIQPEGPFVTGVIALSGDVFRVGLTIAAPVVIAVFLTDVTLGVVNRTAPNIQVFWLGMPLKAVGALLVVFFIVGLAADLFAEMTVSSASALKRAVALLSGAG